MFWKHVGSFGIVVVFWAGCVSLVDSSKSLLQEVLITNEVLEKKESRTTRVRRRARARSARVRLPVGNLERLRRRDRVHQAGEPRPMAAVRAQEPPHL